MSKLQDPIADYLTRIRNAIMARHPKVDVPASKIKREITKVLVDEGYLRDYINIEDDKQGFLRIFLKYDKHGRNAISGLKRVSSPGMRQYIGYREVPRVRNGMGVTLLSTPKGVMTGHHAKTEKIGGEVLMYIW
ncbi:MAG: 30S ribosomal protein S8 [bacterium]